MCKLHIRQYLVSKLLVVVLGGQAQETLTSMNVKTMLYCQV